MESEKPATSSWSPRPQPQVSLHLHDSSGDASEEESQSPIQLNDDLQRKSNSLKNKLRELPTDQPSPTIYKVHKQLRSVNNDAYEPTLVAIGPYHRNKKKLNMMEKKKLQFLQQFLNRRRGLSVEVCFSTIQRLKPEARRWYDEPINLNPPEFVEMLVLDGCFIIEYFLQFLTSSTGMPSWMRSSIAHDLILFENQIPYCVISELFSLIDEGDFSVCLLYWFSCYYPIKECEGNTGSSKDDIKHLLELIYRNFVPTTVSGSSEVAESTNDLDLAEKGQQKIEFSYCNRYFCFFAKALGCEVQPDVSITRQDNSDELDLAEKGQQKKEVSSCNPYLCFSTKALGCIWCSKRQDDSDKPNFVSSATRLSKFNVKFRQQEPNDSIFQIRFEKGTLRLPCLNIQDRTESFFRNLIAYEQYFQSGKNCYVTDFAILFDCLINDEEDVKLLDKCGIIDNWLGSDDVVAHMFNKLCDHVMISSENFTYKGEFKKVKEHCKKRRHAWIANLKQNYFNSPWTGISVIAAFVLIVLTFLQTLFTIK